MFKIIILTFAMLLFNNIKSFSQTIKLRAYQASMIIRNDDPVIRKASFLATFNLDKKKIHLYTNTEKEYDIIKQVKNSNENGVSKATYKGLDDDGEECLIEIVIFKEGMNMGFYSQGVWYIYKFNYD